MNNHLADMIRTASDACEIIFRKTGEILPMYDAIKSDGERIIITVPGCDKDGEVAMIKALFAIENVDRYVFIGEAWTLDSTKSGAPIDIEQVQREGVRNHPDRREAVMFMAENRDGHMLTARRYILRPEHGKPKLTPLEIDPPSDHSEGRMVGLLK